MGIETTNPLLDDLNHVLDYTRDLWEELRGERIFITGGTGFFGCWLLESFCYACDQLDLKTKAVVLTRTPDAFKKKAPHLANHSAVNLQKGNILDFMFPEGSFPFVIHAATQASAVLNRENPLLMFDTIVNGTQRVLDFASLHETRKFLLTSSGAVYGQQPSDLTHIPEKYTGAPDPMDPNSAYGEGKRAAEMLCCLYAKQSDLETKIARCFAFVGPYLPLDVHFAIGNFINDALKSGLIVIKGDGTPYRSYLYAADLAIWLWTILFKGQSCRTYNVGSDKGFSIAEIAQHVAEQFQQKPTIRISGNANLGKPLERYIPAISRSKNELELMQTISLNDAINRTILFYRGKI
jgi:dTDP-glucose 4,6-dehydratase